MRQCPYCASDVPALQRQCPVCGEIVFSTERFLGTLRLKGKTISAAVNEYAETVDRMTSRGGWRVDHVSGSHTVLVRRRRTLLPGLVLLVAGIAGVSLGLVLSLAVTWKVVLVGVGGLLATGGMVLVVLWLAVPQTAELESVRPADGPERPPSEPTG